MKAAEAFENWGIELVVGISAQPELIAEQVSWDADWYTDMLGSWPTRQKEAFETILQNHYSIDAQNKDKYINQPCIVHNRNRKILFWYLPETLTPSWKVFGL